MSHHNVEFKARCDHPDRIRRLLRREGAEEKGTDRQVDTYFQMSDGRLKLREGKIENHLIYYERPDRVGPKEALISLHETEPGTSLKGVLEDALGVDVVVRKTREIYFIDNVKFHIDQVEDLGSFVEVEAIDRDGSRDRETLREQCETYLSLFDVDDDQLVSRSYCDLIREREVGG